MKEANVYKTIRFYWECPICGQAHDWFDEGRFDAGYAIAICKCCMNKVKLCLVNPGG